MNPLTPAAGSLALATGKLHALPPLCPREPYGPSRRVLASLSAPTLSSTTSRSTDRPRTQAGIPEHALHIIHNFAAFQFPLLHLAAPGPGAAT